MADTAGERRTLTFPPKTQHARRDRDNAVAWVVAQEPGQTVESPNVTSTIHKLLRSHGFTVSQHMVKRSMDALVKEGWGESLTIGKRTVMFMLKDDVDVPEPVWIKADKRRSEPAPSEEPTKTMVFDRTNPGVATVSTFPSMPPLPGAPVKEPVYRLEELTKRLEAWYENDPKVYATWVDQAIESLEANT